MAIPYSAGAGGWGTTTTTTQQTAEELQRQIDQLLGGQDSGTVVTTGGGGGGGGGGYSSYSYSSGYDNFEDQLTYGYFMPMLGRAPTAAEISMMRNWSSDHILDWVIQHLQTGMPGYQTLWAKANATWETMVDMGTPLPAGEVDDWIRQGWLSKEGGQAQIEQRIRSLPAWQYGAESKTIKLGMNDIWAQLIGTDLTPEARAKRDEIATQTGGNATAAAALWRDWIMNYSGSYANGVVMSGKRDAITLALADVWGWDQVNAAFAENPNFIDDEIFSQWGENVSSATVQLWARQDPRWLNGPEAANYRVVLGDQWASIMRTPATAEQLNQWALSGWTPAQLTEYMRSTPEYQQIYAAKPAWMDESTFWSYKYGFDAVYRWYFGGASNMYGQVADVECPDSVLADYLARGVQPSEVEANFRYTEQAIGSLDEMNYYGAAIGRTFSLADAFVRASGAQGSGAINAALWRGQQRRQYDTYFAILNGRAPTLSDYEWLENNFVSPEQYYRIETAEQQVEAQFPDADKLMRRIYGTPADKNKLLDMVLGREGGGAYEAMLKAAEELDRYTWVWKSYYRTMPTPQDYARLAGYTGPEELQKEITVRETVLSEGPSIKQVYNKYWTARGEAPLSDEDLETLIGQYQGWGRISAKLKEAQGHADRWDQARRYNLRYGVAMTPISLTEFGGPQATGLRRVGG